MSKEVVWLRGRERGSVESRSKTPAHTAARVFGPRGRELGTCIALTALQGLVSRRNWTMLFALTYSRYPELLRT